MRLMQHNIASLIFRDEPASPVFAGKFSRKLGEKAGCHHVRVEGGLGLFIRQSGVFGLDEESLLQLDTELVACGTSLV